MDISSTEKAFNSLLRIVSEDKYNAFRTNLASLIMPFEVTKEAWCAIVTAIRAILKRYFYIEASNANFFQWIDDADPSQNDSYSHNNKKNVFSYQEESRRTIQIHLSSIHGVKGRTHLATLLLDTYWYKRNIKSILPWLCNASTRPPDNQDLMRLKCNYVALTRAKGLICIAALKSSISDLDKNRLSEFGWNIVEL